MRESFSGLRRADAIVITRSDLVDDTSAVEERLRRKNHSAPMFRASTRIANLVSIDEFHAKAQRTQRDVWESDQAPNLVNGKAGAFCAVGGALGFSGRANTGQMAR